MWKDRTWTEAHAAAIARGTPGVAALLREWLGDLIWEGGLTVQHDVWTYWDGEDDTFDVYELDGIEHLTNLRELCLRGGNQISDWSPLARLPALAILEVTGGRVDLRPLLAAPALQRVTLRFVDGVDEQAVEALRSRGVIVDRE